MRRRITPPAELAAALAASRAHVSYDGRADGINPGTIRLPAHVDLQAAGLEAGRLYVVNADGTLTPREDDTP